MAKRDQTSLVQLKVRMREPVRARVEQDAKRRGVSINAEIVDRLERSFEREDLLPEVMSLNFGKELAGVLMFLGNVMIWADAYHRVDSQPRGPSHKWKWAPDADAYDQSVKAAVAVLEAMRPAEPVKAQSNAGVEMATTIIKAVRGDPDAPETGFTDGAPEIRALLGPLVERLRAEKPARNPFRLGLAVVTATNTLEILSKRHTARGGRLPLPKDEVVEILERYLKDYLATDWQQRGSRDEGQHSETGQEELAAEIRRRA